MLGYVIVRNSLDAYLSQSFCLKGLMTSI